MIIGIIPARGGSKRIPRKNIKSFAGRPIIAYSIEAALSSNIFDKVVVTTDDEEIASISLSLGAEVPFIRPKQLASDHARSFRAIAHALSYYQNRGADISLVCCIYATNPFIKISDLENGRRLICEDTYDFVIAATEYEYPILRSLCEIETRQVVPVFPDSINLRSQDMQEYLHDCGQFYWGSCESFHVYETLFEKTCKRVGYVRIPRHLVHDIDTEEDWIRAELVYKSLNKEM